jgi:hypothetical protein
VTGRDAITEITSSDRVRLSHGGAVTGKTPKEPFQLCRVAVLTRNFESRVMNANFTGLFGLIHLALVVWAAVSILGSSATQGAKVLWILLVLLFPVVGLIIWVVAGPKKT